jgi:hypothetical protein
MFSFWPSLTWDAVQTRQHRIDHASLGFTSDALG